MSEVAKATVLAQADRIIQTTTNEVNRIQGELNQITGVSPATGGSNIRATIEQGRKAVFDELSEQYEDIWRQVPPGVVVDVSGVRATARKWQGRLEEDLFPSLTPEDLKLVQDALSVGLGEMSLKEAVSSGLITQEFADGLFLKGQTGIPADFGVSLAASSRALSILKAEARRLDRGTGEGTIKQKNLLINLISDIEAARSKALTNVDPELQAIIREQDALWQSAKQQIDEALPGTILARRRGSTFRVPDDRVLRQVISSEANLRDYLRTVQDFPQMNAIDDIKQAYDGLYTDQVVNGNTKHATWIARNRDALRLIYTPDEMRRFQNAARLQDDIIIAQKNEKELLRNLSASFDTEVSNFSPFEAVRFTTGNPDRALKMMGFLAKHPDKLEAYRQLRINKLIEDAGDNVNAMARALKGDSRRELEIVLGKEHIKLLDDFLLLAEAEAVKPTSSLVSSIQEEAGGIIPTARNLFFGPLTRAGFRFRVIARFFPRGTDLAMMKILQDPKKLEKMLKLRNTGLNNRKWWNFAFGLGLSAASLVEGLIEGDQAGAGERTKEDLQFLIDRNAQEELRATNIRASIEEAQQLADEEAQARADERK